MDEDEIDKEAIEKCNLDVIRHFINQVNNNKLCISYYNIPKECKKCIHPVYIENVLDKTFPFLKFNVNYFTFVDCTVKSMLKWNFSDLKKKLKLFFN